MPNLKCLSLCETRVANLWTTSAALAKLSSLVQLRFQNYNTDSGHLNSRHLHIGALPFDGEETLNQYLNAEDELTDLFPLDNYDSGHKIQSMLEDSSDDSEVDFSHRRHDFILAELFSDVLPGWNGMVDLQSEVKKWSYITPCCTKLFKQEYGIWILSHYTFFPNIHID